MRPKLLPSYLGPGILLLSAFSRTSHMIFKMSDSPPATVLLSTLAEEERARLIQFLSDFSCGQSKVNRVRSVNK